MDSHKYSAQVERLELIETGRRRRWSDDEKLRIVLESCRRPGISSTARRHGISRSLLVTWRRSFRLDSNGPDAQQAGFVPALVMPAETPPMATAAPTSGQMVIILGKDRRVIVDASVDTAALARVLQVLERG